MVDGLIIPRSYNDYFSKSDPTAIRQLVGQYTDSALSSTSELPVQNKAVKGALDGITELIPAQATAQNQLADKGFVNSSVATNTANYISDNGDPFTSVADLEAYSGTVTNNDYAFVTGTDSDGNTYYDRYKATVSGSTVTWAKEYRLNNSSFTAAQWAAITSGITAAKVAQYDAAVNPIDDTQTLANKTWSSNKISGFANGVVTCTTAAGTATKSITYPGFILQTGAVARVLFVNENSEANPTLRVNSETAVPIKALKGGTKIAPPVHNGKWRGASTATDETWQPYTQLDLMYDGTDFVILGNPLVEDGDTYSIYANGWNDTDEYSTSEIKTNKVWIDGKPIYRKCFYSATGYTANQTIGNITNLDKVLNIICNVFNNANKSVYPNFDDSIEGFYIVNTVNGNVIARLSGDFLGSNPQSCIVEYTKTTD